MIYNLIGFRLFGFVKDCPNRVCSQKRDLLTFPRNLFFWVSGVESPPIFLYKKIRKKLNRTLHD